MFNVPPGMSPEEDSDLEATMAAAVVLAAEDEDATAVPWDDADRAELGGGDAATTEAGLAAAVAGDFFRMLSPPPLWVTIQ